MLHFLGVNGTHATPAERATLLKAIFDDGGNQIELVQTLVSSSDPLVAQALAAWPKGGVFIHETNDTKIAFVLDPQGDEQNRQKAIRIADGELLQDSSGRPLLFLEKDLTPVDTSRSLRSAIKRTLDLMALSNADPKFRRDAANRLGFEQNQDYLPVFQARLEKEAVPVVRKALQEAVAITQLASEDPPTRRKGVETLGELRSISASTLLKKILAEAKTGPKKYDEETVKAAGASLAKIETYGFWGETVGRVFRGLSLGAVLLVAALGLAITFGLMGVINMAHGEMIMVGAYAAFVTQRFFLDDKLQPLALFDWYFPLALVTGFLSAGAIGLILERGIIRFLYARPLESLLATWGVSLILQQAFRRIFGAANVSVISPAYLKGTYEAYDILFAYNRLFLIAFGVLIVVTTYLLMNRTSIGLQIRAVMQNRNMAACVGVRTDRMNMITFAFGSGLAGLAGACLSLIGNIGPQLGQSYIVDCFMIVVLGGVGNLAGTVCASWGVGTTDQMLQPFMGAVLGKITVLVAIILFLQWRPAGLFVTRTRSLEG
ncbi:MAG: urea ABC transporter permease subunit UrtB [Verrucomicrobia bacterium]|nr:urea ABC transporter permease subunit UrtB [Verrucomicrobiota bacterium]